MKRIKTDQINTLLIIIFFWKELAISFILTIILLFLINYATFENEGAEIALTIPFFVLSYLTHEYFHLLEIKKTNLKEVYIEKKIYRFSIYHKDNLKASEMNRIAASGPVFNFLIGLFIAIINYLFFNSMFFKIISVLFSVHIIYILPFFGDGKIILRNFLKGGDQSD